MSEELEPVKEKLPTIPSTDKCNGILRSGEGYCKRRAGDRTEHQGTGRCWLHGGASLRGYASPNYKTGKYSKYLLAKLGDIYGETMQDGSLLELESSIGLVDTFIKDLLSNDAMAGNKPFMKEITAAYEDLLTAVELGEDLGATLETIGYIISRGNKFSKTRDEVVKLTESMRRLIESENKRRQEMMAAIPIERLMALISHMTQIIMRHVPERERRERIQRDLTNILGSHDIVETKVIGNGK